MMRTLGTELLEAVVVGLEVSCFNYLRSPARTKQLDSWVKAIDRKVG